MPCRFRFQDQVILSFKRDEARDVVLKLNHEIIDILKVKQVADSLLQQGAIPDFNTPEQFEAYIKSEIAKWGAVVRAANIRAD